MASLHSAAGAPAALDPRVFAVHHNPFLETQTPAAPAPTLEPLNLKAAAAESVEVTALWGTTVLTVAELSPPRAYAIGELGAPGGAGTSPDGDVDFAVSAERLGCPRRALVVMRDGAPFALLGAGEAARVLEDGRYVDASHALVDCSEIAPGARGLELRRHRVVLLDAGGLSFRIAGGEKAERLPRAALGSADRSALLTMGTAALLQGLLVASLAYFTPRLAYGDDDELNRERLQLMQQYLHASAAREEPPPPETPEAGGGEKGAPAERHRGPEGAAGNPSAKQAGRMAIKGDTAERALSRAEMLKEATTFGTIGLLATLNASTSPSSPWGADLATGPDSVDAMGDWFSPSIGEGFGHGGLGISGTGLGGGGLGRGVGIDRIGTCLGVNCYGNGDGGFGRSAALTRGGHVTRAPRVASQPPTLSGHLPPDVIQRVVRQNFGRFRSCYEVGLRSNPNLEGRVTARFVIGRDGAVSNVSAGGDLPDSSVRSCVASAFYGLTFPAPDSGIVTVTYPILLTPGG